MATKLTSSNSSLEKTPSRLTGLFRARISDLSSPPPKPSSDVAAESSSKEKSTEETDRKS